MDTPSIKSTIFDSLSSLWTQFRAAVLVPVSVVDTEARDAEGDVDLEGWLRGDPFVPRNLASRYGDRSPGYLTRNGLGSLEVGGAQNLNRWRE